MKIVLIVLLVLVLLLVIVCLSSVTASVSCRDGTFEWSVKYFGIRILPRANSGGKPKIAGRHKKSKTEEAATAHKKFLMDRLWAAMQDIVGKLDIVSSGIAALPGPLQKLLKAITWSDIAADFVIGGEDAADAARMYGIVQAGVQTVIDASRHVIHVRRKDVRIRCDFTEDSSKWDFSFACKVQIGSMLGALIWLVWSYFRDSGRSGKVLVGDVL